MPIEILMPALSPTMTEGNLAKWNKKEGDRISAGDTIAEIETDKATMEVEAVDEGILAKILIPAGTDGVKVNTLIALLLEEGEDPDSLKNYSSKSIQLVEDKKEPVASEPAQVEKENIAVAFNERPSQRILASPLARRMAQGKGISLEDIQGSGPYGRIVKKDVENAQPHQPASRRESLSHGPLHEDKPLSNMRKVIAKRLVESKQTIPHFYLTVECEIDQLLTIRKQLNEEFGSRKVTVNDFVIKAVAMALRDVPEANASWMGDSIRYYKQSDVAVAVSIDEGLITPIIRAAETKSIFALSAEIKELAARARDGKLKPEEFQGGSFSVSNLGMYGIKEFSAIINPPQACILAVGAGEERAVVRKGALAVATMMNCTLSVDHRVVDGKVGADFLTAFKKYIQNPVLMIMTA
jgi:pyruvate dehydrogenase E2 component (dihydrolipoamide acetyltransferase)